MRTSRAAYHILCTLFSTEQLFHKLRTLFAYGYINTSFCRQYCPGYNIKKNKLDRARGTCWGGGMHTGFGCGNLVERDHLEDLGVDGRIMMELFPNRLGRG
jgi:hypothetical protein